MSESLLKLKPTEVSLAPYKAQFPVYLVLKSTAKEVPFEC